MGLGETAPQPAPAAEPEVDLMGLREQPPKRQVSPCQSVKLRLSSGHNAILHSQTMSPIYDLVDVRSNMCPLAPVLIPFRALSAAFNDFWTVKGCSESRVWLAGKSSF